MAEEVKWEGKFREEVKGIRGDKVWPFLEDFCNLHKVFPFVDNSWRLEGEDGKPGLVRYCTATANKDADLVFWAKEKLVMIDASQRCLTYQVLENNLGIKYYVATMKVLPMLGGGDEEEQGCCIEWTVVADPMEGRTFQVFQSDWISYLHSIVQTIQKILLS